MNSLKFEKIVQCIGDFYLVNKTEIIDIEKVVATSGRKFIFHNQKKYKYFVIPGRKLTIS